MAWLDLAVSDLVGLALIVAPWGLQMGVCLTRRLA